MSLPDLLEKKSKLNVHANIMQCTMNEVARRNIPTFQTLEEDMLRSGYADKAKVLDLLNDNEKDLKDKVRLAIVYASCARTSSADVSEAEAALRGAADLRTKLRGVAL